MRSTYIASLLLILFLIPTGSIAQTQATAGKDTSAIIQTQDGSQLANSLQQAQPDWSVGFGKIFWSLVVLIVGFIIIKYLTRLLERLAEHWTNLRLGIKRLIPILRIIGWTTVIYIIIAEVLAPPIATIVAVTASAGIAVGFASQDILKSIFGGIMILFDRPFQVGDKIEVGSYYGEVVSIGLRTVRIVTKDDSLVSIPNNEIVNQAVSNANSGESNCQVVAEFYLPADIDLIRARKIANRAAAVSRYVYLKKPIAVIFKNEVHQGRSLLKMRLKAYVLDIRFEFAFASEMTETVTREFLRKGLISSEQLSFFRSADAKTVV